MVTRSTCNAKIIGSIPVIGNSFGVSIFEDLLLYRAFTWFMVVCDLKNDLARLLYGSFVHFIRGTDVLKGAVEMYVWIVDVDVDHEY